KPGRTYAAITIQHQERAIELPPIALEAASQFANCRLDLLNPMNGPLADIRKRCEQQIERNRQYHNSKVVSADHSGDEPQSAGKSVRNHLVHTSQSEAAVETGRTTKRAMAATFAASDPPQRGGKRICDWPPAQQQTHAAAACASGCSTKSYLIV